MEIQLRLDRRIFIANEKYLWIIDTFCGKCYNLPLDIAIAKLKEIKCKLKSANH